MPAKYYIRAGFVESNARAGAAGNSIGPNAPLSNGKFDLHRWLRSELASLNVMNVDACCTPDPTLLPLRYNFTLSKIQYLNTSGVWTSLASF